MGIKVGDTTSFYDVKARKKVSAKVSKISTTRGRKRAQGRSSGGTKLSKFIK